MKLANLSHFVLLSGVKGVKERDEEREEEWKEGMGRWEFTWESFLKNLH